MLSFTGRLEDMTLGGGRWGAEVSQFCVCVCVCIRIPGPGIESVTLVLEACGQPLNRQDSPKLGHNCEYIAKAQKIPHLFVIQVCPVHGDFTGGASGTEPTKQCKTWVRPLGGEDYPGRGHGNPLQYSCMETPMDRGACWALVYRVAKSQA